MLIFSVNLYVGLLLPLAVEFKFIDGVAYKYLCRNVLKIFSGEIWGLLASVSIANMAALFLGDW